MLEPPKVADAAIMAALHTHFGLSITELAFLPIGADSASSVYRAAAGGATYFVKLRSGEGFSAPSLVIPHFLHTQGVPHILAPLLTANDTLWASVDAFALSVYPLLDAQTAKAAGLSEQQWRELGVTARLIHASVLPSDLKRIVRSESFVPSRRDVMPGIEGVVSRQDSADPDKHELALFWRSQQQRIRMVVERADALGDELRRRDLPLLLCHADLHTNNVLVDKDGQLWIVDWDEIVLAPKERDLMFVIGGIGHGLVSPHDTGCFLQGYGETTIDAQALSYYRYAWAVQDIAAYGEQALLTPDVGRESRRNAVRRFISLFAPGNIVDIACG